MARRFLAAFLAYEVGQLNHGVRSALRATATPRFSAALLRAPPSGAPSPAQARIERLAINLAMQRPPRALVSGSARRGGGVEQFSFLFEARRGSWLAAGPAE